METPPDRPTLPAEHAVESPASDRTAAPAASRADSADGNRDRLSAALNGLVERGVLNSSQAAAVLTELTALPHQPQPKGARRLFAEVAGYVGASFVVGAAVLFLSEQWEPLGRGGRFSILAAMFVILFGSGLVVHRSAGASGHPWWGRQSGDNVRRRLSSTLLTGAAAAAGFAAYAGLDVSAEYDGGGTPPVDNAPLVASVAGLAVVIVGYLLARSGLGQLGTAVAAFTVYSTLLDRLGVENTGALGVGTLALGALWAVLAWKRLVAEHRFALTIAVAFGLVGAQTLALGNGQTENLIGYALTAVVAGICFAAYTQIREWVVLAGGVVGATLAVPEFLHDVTNGSLGASGVMLVAGLTLLAGSLAGLRLRRGSDHGAAPGWDMPDPS